MVAFSFSSRVVALSRLRRAAMRLVVRAEPARVVLFGARDAHWSMVNSLLRWFEEGGATTYDGMVLDNTPGLRVGNLAFFDCRRAGGGAVTTWFNQADFFVDFPLRDPADVQGIVLGGDTDQAGVRRPWL